MAFQNLHLATLLDIFLKKVICQDLTPDRPGKKVQQFFVVKCRKSLLCDKLRYKLKKRISKSSTRFEYVIHGLQLEVGSSTLEFICVLHVPLELAVSKEIL